MKLNQSSLFIVLILTLLGVAESLLYLYLLHVSVAAKTEESWQIIECPLNVIPDLFNGVVANLAGLLRISPSYADRFLICTFEALSHMAGVMVVVVASVCSV